VKPVEAAALIGISKSKTYEMLAKGELPSVKLGGLIKIPFAALQKLADEAMAGHDSAGTRSGKR
jgi:excisionase family DNA binding protein